MYDSLTNELLVTLAAGKPPVIGGSDSLSTGASEGAPSDGAGAAGGGGTGTSPAGGAGFNIVIFGFLIFFVILIWSQMSQSKKEKRRKQEMFNSLAKHDRVQTIGGIIGTIAEMSELEVVLRVDEATNTRVRVSRAAVQTVLKKGRGGSDSENEVKPEQIEASV